MAPRQRLEAFLKRTPDALDRLSLREIGAQTQMSGEYVRLLLREMGYRTDDLLSRRVSHAARLRQQKLIAFLKLHPEASNTPARGGMTFAAIARRLGVSADFVGDDWQALGLPHRALQTLSPQEKGRRNYARRKAAHDELTNAWKRRNPERAREIQRAADRKYKATVLCEESCVICGARFPWTRARENARRRRGRRIVCSRRCAMVGLPHGTPRREARDERAPRAARSDRQPQARSGQPKKDRRRRA
jgi:hypothetical protein